MAKAKLTPSSLARLIEDAEQSGLSQGKIAMIRALAEAELERRKGENTIREFHDWIRRGDQILNEMETEIRRLRAVTSKDGELISKDAVLDLISSLFSAVEDDRYDMGRNWVLRKLQEGVEELPAMRKAEG